MRKRLIVIALAVCLLAAGAAVYHAGFSAPPEETVTRMAELGLMLLDDENGVSVLAVRDRSAAERAGILPGDVLLQADGHAFGSVLELEEMLLSTQQHMQLQLRRNQEELMTVQLSVY